MYCTRSNTIFIRYHPSAAVPLIKLILLRRSRNTIYREKMVYRVSYHCFSNLFQCRNIILYLLFRYLKRNMSA